MPWTIGKKGIDFLINNATKESGQGRSVEISFWGGEPLLRGDLIQRMLAYRKEQAAKNKVPIMFGGTTNGTLLTPEKFDVLDKYGCKFLVSFDGTPETP